MHRGGSDLEVVLEVTLCRWPAVELSIGVEEGQVLALDGGKSRRLRGAILRHANCFTAGLSAKEPSRCDVNEGSKDRFFDAAEVDEGRPLDVGRQRQASNQVVRLGSKRPWS
jgi:hypothetical protein